MKNCYVECPTKDMWNLVWNKLRTKFNTMSGTILSFNEHEDGIPNLGIYGGTICRHFSPTSGELISYSELLQRLDMCETKIRLNSEYTATIHKDSKTVKVGCQSFSFDVVKELYEAIQ